MPSNKKMLLNARNRITASARARISVKKKNKKTATQLDGSYLEPRHSKTVSTVHKVDQTLTNTTPSTNYAIMVMLQETKESNVALAWRMEKVELSSLRDTPLNSHSHPQGLPSPSSQIGSPQWNPSHAEVGGQIRDPLTFMDFRHFVTGPAQSHPQELQQDMHQPRPSLPACPQLQDLVRSHMDCRDTVISNLQSLRTNPTVSGAVNSLLVSYDSWAQQELSQGKPPPAKRSGCFNTHDTISTHPHLRWPNKGFHVLNGKRRLTYDELSLPQWVAGQLTNIYAITDPGLVKQAILQMTLAMHDATSLPWSAVRGAWASFMHEVEDSTLTWVNSTQWAINKHPR